MLWSFVYRKFPKDYVPTVFETHASKFTLCFKKKKGRCSIVNNKRRRAQIYLKINFKIIHLRKRKKK